MPPLRDQAVDRIRRDHEYMVELAHRIQALCNQGAVGHCGGCGPDQRQVCHGDIEHLIRAFIEATQKHHVIESLLMNEGGVPLAHSIVHKQAHTDLAGRMKTIRVAFCTDGDCMMAIERVDHVLKDMLAHFDEYDQPLESYLLAPA